MATTPRQVVRFGPYALTGRLGEGGMCHVYRARKDGESRDCAVKMLKDKQLEDERVLDLFVTEADLSLLLKHPNLIRTLDAGEVDHRYYIAMELIEGPNLKEIAKQCMRIGVPLPPDFALFLVHEVLQGLGALHDATAKSDRPLSLVHRDVTPSNVFVSFDGRVILGDFGIAHIRAYGRSDPNQALGKIGYLSPEIVTGVPIDGRSDLFAIGIILWELLTAHRLYADGSDTELMLAISRADVIRPRRISAGLPQNLDNIVTKALARKPKERFQTAAELADALAPHWSPQIGNADALGAFLAGLFRESARRFRQRQSG